MKLAKKLGFQVSWAKKPIELFQIRIQILAGDILETLCYTYEKFSYFTDQLCQTYNLISTTFRWSGSTIGRLSTFSRKKIRPEKIGTSINFSYLVYQSFLLSLYANLKWFAERYSKIWVLVLTWNLRNNQKWLDAPKKTNLQILGPQSFSSTWCSGVPLLSQFKS